ncbi:MAG: PKD domain-containing protein, partial [Anaerolineae bacterium]|nr:PKD domain-containing protein [Anaerolineae bacterium]
VNAGADATIDEGGTFESTGSFADPGADTWSATVDYGDGSGIQPLDLAADKTFALSHTYADNGNYTVTVWVKDDDDGEGSGTAQVTVNNVAPTVDAGPNATINEGGTFESTGSFADPGADTWSATVDHGDGSGIQPLDLAADKTFALSHTYADNNTYFVEVCVTDDDDEEDCDTAAVAVANVDPAVDAGADAMIDEGGTFTGSGSFTDPGADTWTATVDYGDGSGRQALTLAGKSFDLSHTYGDDGSYVVTVCVTDDDRGNDCDTATVTVANVAPAVTADPTSQTVQYSEPISTVTFIATDVAADVLTAALSWSSSTGDSGSDAPAGLALSGGEPCATAGSVRTCAWKLTGNVAMPAGSYTLRLTVTDDDGDATYRDVTLIVTPEEATVEFTDNPIAVQVAKPGGVSGAFSIEVCVSERDAPPAGDITKAQVTLSLVPVGPGKSVVGTADDPTYRDNQKKCVTFRFGDVNNPEKGVPVNAYTVQVTVGGGYYVGTGEDVLVVYDPSLGFTTGGGWFYWPDTAIAETGYPGDRTTFGFTMKYNKKATNIQGNLLLIRHMADGTIYRVKSNALYGLALGEVKTIPMGWASFSGKSTYLEPGWTDPKGNYEFVVYVEDRNEPGTGVDRFWIEVLGGLALPRDAVTYTVILERGNLVVPHKAK